jgi:hypothetical protein
MEPGEVNPLTIVALQQARLPVDHRSRGFVRSAAGGRETSRAFGRFLGALGSFTGPTFSTSLLSPPLFLPAKTA